MKLKEQDRESLVQTTFRCKQGDYTDIMIELKLRGTSFNQWINDKIKQQLEEWKNTTK